MITSDAPNYAQTSLLHAQNAIHLQHNINKIKFGKYNLLYLNINSLLNKLDDLESTIANLNGQNIRNKIHFIALTEIRLHEHQTPYFNMQNYTPYFCTRDDGYGGCALFVHASLNSNLIEKISSQGIELLTVKIVDLALNVTVVYKQPSVNNDSFTDILHKYIEKKRKMIMIGDMNIDLMKNSNTMRRYIDSMTSNGQIILNKINKKYATRSAHKKNREGNNFTESNTIIDHVATDCLNFSFKLSQVTTHMSDHMQMHVSFDDHKSESFSCIQTVETYSKLDSNAYERDITQFLTNSITATTDELINGLNNCKTKHMHTITNSKRCNPTKPWLNSEFFDLLQERNRYFYLKKKSPTNEYLKHKYEQICDEIQSKRYFLRTNYNSNLINKHANNPKIMWSKLNEIIYNKKQCRNHISAIINPNNGITTNKSMIANTLNEYFINVGKTLHDAINIQSRPLHFYTCPNILNSMYLYFTNENEVASKIYALKNSNCLKDYISANTVKKHCDLITPRITKLINDSFRTELFPSSLKQARIVPIHKTGDRLLPANYRPISLLPSLSKIFESILCDRINKFLALNNIIHANQYGFQKQSGSLSAAATVIDLLQTKLDENCKTFACCIFIDLCKAFDTIPHEQLLKILYAYGFRGRINLLLRDYLKNRMQYVDIGDSHGDNSCNPNPFALPQGSNLGPLLFLIYINGIFDLKLNGTLVLFADDATLIYFDTDPNLMQNKIQEDLNLISSWFTYNKLTVNASKTKYMLIKPGRPLNMPNLSINISNTVLSRVTSFKYLGITIQENLKWDIHIDTVCRKIMGISCVMNRFGCNLNNTARISLYYSMVNSHLSYLNPIWGTSATLTDIARLQVAQNHAIRKFFYYDYHYLNLSSSDIKQKYKILNVQQLLRYNKLIISFKIDKRLMKCNFKFDTAANHEYLTRNCEQIRLPVFRTITGRNSIFRHCAELYRATSIDLKNSRTLQIFKKKLKSSMF